VEPFTTSVRGVGSLAFIHAHLSITDESTVYHNSSSITPYPLAGNPEAQLGVDAEVLVPLSAYNRRTGTKSPLLSL
jgi:hypothetical protein